MSFIIDDYLNLIPSANRQKPKFIATLTVFAGAMVHIQDLMASMIPLFDLETAVGDQLDIIGEWVGLSRNISIPIPTTGILFEWDGSAANGWDIGIWQDPEQPTEIATLPDDIYRIFIKAKIAANKWNGSLEDMYAVWDSVFTDVSIFVNDKQDMSYDIGFVGAPVDSLTLALIETGYLPLKPEGVRVDVVYSPVDAGPLFAWDVESTMFQGWDTGSWARIT